MKEIAAVVVSLFEGLRLPFRWAAILSVFLLLIGGIWGYERLTGNFYLSKLERKTALLKELQSIASSGIENQLQLQPIYASTLKELESVDVSEPLLSALPSLNLRTSTAVWKAVSGAILWILVLIFGISSEVQKTGRITGAVLALGIVLALIALLFAWIGTLLPTLLNPWVNYIGFPAVQTVALVLLTRKKPLQSK